ncbi:endonuclease domain-containing protein [Enterovirga aerilata]|uniref:Endonuclease domain-containing protein n=1 Tax=Enterovirga aerilata TaxID=2730920 RepID=A0A849I6G0_9HYPH|nr:endonuclease domain-containing protein [Enterovirga sp. DB1703]NNM73284.1 endonuclease domain-containing protein [Enterovirga sp. DB1703]
MPNLTPVARRLRRKQTEVERLLWSRLRDRRLGGWKFRRQMPIGQHVVDFCCPDAWLIIELDGEQHAAEEKLNRDRQRTVTLEAGGYLVVRFWNREVIENLDGVCETILNLLQGAPADLDQPALRADI